VSQEEERQYRDVINYTSFESLRNMNRDMLENHLQMLVEILQSNYCSALYELLEPTLSVLIEFFQHSFNHWHRHYSHYLEQHTNGAETDILPSVIMNKILSFFPPQLFVKFIGSTYYTIVPQNLPLLRKVLVLLREMLTFAIRTPAEIKHNLEVAGESGEQPVNSAVGKNGILTTFMNITYAEDHEVLRIVYEEGLVQNLALWIEEHGFSELEKETISAIYSNMIQFLCSLAAEASADQGLGSEHSEQSLDYFLFLPIF
jgi:hypothetical protein